MAGEKCSDMGKKGSMLAHNGTLEDITILIISAQCSPQTLVVCVTISPWGTDSQYKMSRKKECESSWSSFSPEMAI